MKDPPLLLDPVASRQIAQRWMGERMVLSLCPGPPDGFFRYGRKRNALYYFHATLKSGPCHVGADLYVAVDRRTGAIIEFSSGE